MSKPVKELIMVDYKRRFDDIEGALIIDVRGIDANDNNSLRLDLATKNIRITVIKNTLAKKAFDGTGLAPLIPALEGPAALAYGGGSVVDVARALVAWAKKLNDLDLKGAVLDGEYYEGEAGVKRLSNFPTQEEAQAQAVQLILTPGGTIVGAVTGGGSRILGIVKEIQERLERGETMAKVG